MQWKLLPPLLHRGKDHWSFWRDVHIFSSSFGFGFNLRFCLSLCRDTTIINHSPCHSSNNSFNEDLPVADYRNQEMENRCIPRIKTPTFTENLHYKLFHSSICFLTRFSFSVSHQDPCSLRSDLGKRRSDQDPEPAAAPRPGAEGRAKPSHESPEHGGGVSPTRLLHSLHQHHHQHHKESR